MNKQYHSTKNAYQYPSLKNENDYTCKYGCTCKFLDNRSEYDKQQFNNMMKNNSTDYEKNMFLNYKQKYN